MYGLGDSLTGYRACQTVFTSASGSTVSIASGASTPLVGTATRPDDGIYTHVFVEMSNVLVIGDSREYSTSLDGYNIAANTANGGGVFCATTAAGSKYGAAAITAVNHSSVLGDLNGAAAGYINQLTGIANAVGASSVYLVDSAYSLEADTATDVIYLDGGQFWTDAAGLIGRNVLIMNGANGQTIAMDMDKSWIVAISAGKSNHVNEKKLAYEPIKYGRIR